MGHRLEIFTTEATALDMITVANDLQIEAKIIGHVETSGKKNWRLL